MNDNQRSVYHGINCIKSFLIEGEFYELNSIMLIKQWTECLDHSKCLIDVSDGYYC